MAIENTTVKTDVYVGDGSNKTFAFDFRIEEANDLKVYVKNAPGDYVLQTLDTDYTLSLTYNTDGSIITGGTITYPKTGSALPSTGRIYAIRQTDDTQELSSDSISFQSKDIEQGLDKITMRLQEFTEEISHFITIDDLPEIIIPDLSSFIKNNTTQTNAIAILGTVSAEAGIAIGNGAVCNGSSATQIGVGQNDTNGTLQFKDYRLLNADGTIPDGRVPQLSNKANTDLSNVSANIDYVVEMQLPTSQNSYQWYRKYKSGWVEQGGRYTLTNQGDGGETITLPVEMADTTYSVTTAPLTNGDNWPFAWSPLSGWTTTTINIDGTGNITTAERTITIQWEVKGFSAVEE